MKRAKLADPANTLETVVSGGTKFNDLATQGRFVLISDMGAGEIRRFDPQTGEQEVWFAPPSVNGITTNKRGRLYAVSWTEHEIYDFIEPDKLEPRPFGLADHFTNLDGIEIFDDGSIIVSDFKGNKVSLVSPDRKTVRTLIEIESPADIGLDRERSLLYVPQFKKDRVVVFSLTRE